MNELQAFEKHLRENEKSPATIEKYLRDARAFLSWLDGREPTKELTVCYKEGLTERYEAASVNSMLAGINSYLSFSGRADCRVKPLRVQRTLFGSEERELSREEYARLVHAAGGGGPAQGVFPHSLRHLFARVFYSVEKDLLRLADILGHASVNTTCIYTMETGRQHMNCWSESAEHCSHNGDSVAAEVYRRKRGGVGDKLRNRRIAATILTDYKENGGTRP